MWKLLSFKLHDKFFAPLRIQKPILLPPDVRFNIVQLLNVFQN